MYSLPVSRKLFSLLGSPTHRLYVLRRSLSFVRSSSYGANSPKPRLSTSRHRRTCHSSAVHLECSNCVDDCARPDSQALNPMCPPTRNLTEQELHGRHGRPITDQDAQEINRIEELSYDLKIREVMTADLKTAPPDLPLSKVLDILRINRISGLPVVENGKLVGVLSLEDIVRALQKNDLSAPTSHYMTREVVTVASYDSIVNAIRTFTEIKLGRLPVVDENDNLVGMIT